MKRAFTAQEMRLLAKMIDHHGGAFVLTDPSILESNVAMLRQAADDMEREKKYEYLCEEKIPKKGWLPVNDFRWSTLGAARQYLTNMNCKFKTRIIRREVGEWEVVKDA